MRGGALWVAVMLVTLVSPLAAADVDVEGPVRVFLDDQRPRDCTPGPLVACVAEAPDAGEDVGNATIDANTRITRAGVIVDPEHVPLAGGLLPRYALVIEGNSTFLSYELLEKGIALYEERVPQRPVGEAAWLRFDRDAVAIHYYGPPLLDPTGPSADQSHGVSLETEDEGWLGHDQLGPTNRGATTSTDIQLGPLPLLVCDVADPSASCYESALQLQETYNSTTPNVLVGAEWDELAAGTDPDAIQAGSRGLVRTHADAPSLARASLPVRPMERLATGPVTPPGLSIGGPTGPVALPSGPSSPPPASTPAGSEVFARAIVPGPETPILVNLGVGVALAAVLQALYSRFASKEAVANHPVRSGILRRVMERREGTSLVALQEELALNRSTLLYHLTLLERHGCVQAKSVNGAVRIFPPGARPDPLRAELDHPTRGPVLAALQAEPAGLTRAQLHERTAQLPVRTRNHTISRLVQLGLVEIRHDGADARLCIAARDERDARAA